jgi:hypothetical protein
MTGPGPGSDAQDTTEPIAQATAAVAACRDLAAADPAQLPELSDALVRLSGLLAGAGCTADAVPPAEEAVRIRRALPDVDPGALAVALHALERRLGDTGRYPEAIAVAGEAAEIYRGLVAPAPDVPAHDLTAHRRRLASLLTDLGYWSSVAGRPGPAAAASAEAVELRRQLVVEDETLAAGLAHSLGSHAHHLLQNGDLAGALAAAEEAMAVVRSLHAVDDASHLRQVTRAMAELSIALFAAGRHTEGRETAREAARTSRLLVAAAGDRELPLLASSLNDYAYMLSSAPDGDSDPSGPDPDPDSDPVAVSAEAVALLRRLAAADPAVHRRGLGRALTTSAITLAEAGRGDDAAAAAAEAFDIQRDRAETDPPAYCAAAKLLAVTLLATGKAEESLAVAQEARTRIAPLADVGTGLHHRSLLAALSVSLGDALLALGRFGDARVAYADGIAACRLLAGADRGAHLAELAFTLVGVAEAYADADRAADALPLASEAHLLFGELADADPVAFDSAVTGTAELVAELTRRTTA